MNYRLEHVAISLALLTFPACQSGTGPSDLGGRWRTIASPGSRIEVSLHNVLDVITGAGAQYIEGNLFDSLTVNGRWGNDHSVHLNPTFRSSTPAIYDAVFVGSNQLDGTFTRNGQTATHFAFYRETQ